jgi:hypothetical protein
MNPGGFQMIYAAIISLFGSVLIFWLGVWNEKRKAAKRDTDVIDGMRRSHLTYTMVEEIIWGSSADRAILFAGHNSGGIPRPSSSFWASAIYWHARKPEHEKQLSEYQKLEVDAHYIQTLLDTERSGMVQLETAKLPQSQLRRYYQAEGVQHSAVFFLKIVENKFLYLSVAKYTDEPFTEVEITRIGIKIGMIQASI